VAFDIAGELDLSEVSSIAYQRRGDGCVSVPSLPLNHCSLQHRRTDGLNEHSAMWVSLRNVTGRPRFRISSTRTPDCGVKSLHFHTHSQVQ